MIFKKVLAKYYKQWYQDSLDSIEYCKERGKLGAAREYEESAEIFKKILDGNKEAIEFFSQGDNAFKIDRVLPEKFRGYK